MLFVFMLGFSVRADALSLTEIAATVLSANAAMDSAEAQSDQAQSGISYARAAYFPGLSVSGSYTRGNNPVYAFGTLLGQSRFESGDFVLDKLNHPSALDNLQGQAGIQMQILNWRRKGQVEAARSVGRAAQEGRRLVRQQLLAQTIEVYCGILLAQKQSDILRERIQESEGELKDATRLKDQGLVLGSDYHLARSILGQLRQQLVQAESQIRSAKAVLNVLMTRREEDVLDISGDLAWTQTPALDWASLTGSLAAHPLLNSAKYSSEGAEWDAKAESRGSWPVFSGFSTVEGNGYKMDAGGWNYLAGLKLAVPLFDPGQGPRTQLKQSAARQAQDAGKMAEDRQRVDLYQKFRFYQAAKDRLPLAAETEDEARNALSMFKKLYRSGRQSIADVLQGEAALAQSQSALQQVYFDLRVGYARTLEAAGRLEDVPEPFARP